MAPVTQCRGDTAIVILVWIVLSIVSYAFSPSHSFPNVSESLSLAPFSNKSVSIPGSAEGLLSLAGLFFEPLIYARSSGASLEILELGKIVDSGPLYGFGAVNVTNSLTVVNPSGEDVEAVLEILRAPPIDQLGTYSDIWNGVIIFVGVLGTLITSWCRPTNISDSVFSSLTTALRRQESAHFSDEEGGSEAPSHACLPRSCSCCGVVYATVD